MFRTLSIHNPTRIYAFFAKFGNPPDRPDGQSDHIFLINKHISEIGNDRGAAVEYSVYGRSGTGHRSIDGPPAIHLVAEPLQLRMSAEHDRLEIVAHRLPPPANRSVQTLEQRTVRTARRDTGISLGRRDGLGRLHDQEALPSQREIDRFENLSATISATMDSALSWRRELTSRTPATAICRPIP